MNTCCHAMMSGAAQSQVASGQILWYQRKRLTPFMDSAALQQCDVIWAAFKAFTRQTEGFFLCGEDEKEKCFNMTVRRRYGVFVILRDGLVARGPAQDTATVGREQGREVDGGGVLLGQCCT